MYVTFTTHVPPEFTISEDNQTVNGEVAVLTDHNGCAAPEVGEAPLRPASRPDTGAGHVVWEAWERGKQEVGTGPEAVRVVGAEPGRLAWPRPSELV